MKFLKWIWLNVFWDEWLGDMRPWGFIITVSALAWFLLKMGWM